MELQCFVPGVCFLFSRSLFLKRFLRNGSSITNVARQVVVLGTLCCSGLMGVGILRDEYQRGCTFSSCYLFFSCFCVFLSWFLGVLLFVSLFPLLFLVWLFVFFSLLVRSFVCLSPPSPLMTQSGLCPALHSTSVDFVEET